MISGRREPPVTSRTNQFSSLAPMSHVCAVKPPPLVCSWRTAGVSVAVMWRLSPGLLLPKPTLPVDAMKSEFVGEFPVTVNGVFEFVTSSIENLFAPPLALSFAVSCQSLLGKPEDVLVSSNLMRVLFSLRRIVSKPNDSLTTQSRPMQALPCTMMSSAVTTSCTFTGGAALPLAADPEGTDIVLGVMRRGASDKSGEMNAPFATVNAPDWYGRLFRPAAAWILSIAASSFASRAAASWCFTSPLMWGTTRNSYV